MRSPQDTIAAVATPLGEGGLGVIRVSGARALSIVSALFRSPKNSDLTTVASHTCHVGRLHDDDLAPIDYVVVTVFRAPQSYTGEEVAEISAHGSPIVLAKILHACFRLGARPGEPGEFTERAFLNGKIDLTQAEAVVDLIQAKSEKARAAAVGQLEGRLAIAVRGIRDQLLPILAHVEVGLDHSDEDHDFLQRAPLVERCTEMAGRVDQLIASGRLSHLLRHGLRVALVGRPNVGKSSLLNALLKTERAIVTPIAGTTRDTLEESVSWDGLPVVLTDTAGLRGAPGDSIEKLGMARSRAALAAADFVFGMLDASQPLLADDDAVVRACQEKPHAWVRTKCDLPSLWDPSELHRLNGHAPVVDVSVVTGSGIPALVAVVKEFAQGADAGAGSAQWMLNARHCNALERSRLALTRATEAAQQNDYEECVAVELQTALAALGEIIGETATDDLLAQIFKQFCVGK